MGMAVNIVILYSAALRFISSHNIHALNSSYPQPLHSLNFFLLSLTPHSAVYSMGIQFGSFNGICQTAALIICPLIGSNQGIGSSCYSRNVNIVGTLIFQPCELLSCTWHQGHPIPTLLTPSFPALPSLVTLFVHFIAILMTGIMIYHIWSKYTAVGKCNLLCCQAIHSNEWLIIHQVIVMFFYLYVIIKMPMFLLDYNFIPKQTWPIRWAFTVPRFFWYLRLTMVLLGPILPRMVHCYHFGCDFSYLIALNQTSGCSFYKCLLRSVRRRVLYCYCNLQGLCGVQEQQPYSVMDCLHPMAACLHSRICCLSIGFCYSPSARRYVMPSSTILMGFSSSHYACF